MTAIAVDRHRTHNNTRTYEISFSNQDGSNGTVVTLEHDEAKHLFIALAQALGLQPSNPQQPRQPSITQE